ncbi:MAG: helix-turn-helix domain-containing protein [Lachnospirales bacterium]
MSTEIGDILKYFRDEKKYTVSQIEALSNISSRQIHRIDNNTYKSNINTISALCKSLKIYVGSYADVIIHFNSKEQYKRYQEIKRYIEHKNISKLKTLLSKSSDEKILSLDYSAYKQIIFLGKAYIAFYGNNEDNKALDYCFYALNTTEYDFEKAHKESFLGYESSYAVFNLMAVIYAKKSKYKNSKTLLDLIINSMRSHYSSETIPCFMIPMSVYRNYIIANNSLASLYLEKGNYIFAKEICQSLINFCIENDFSYDLETSYKILFKITYAEEINNVEPAICIGIKAILHAKHKRNQCFVDEFCYDVLQHYPLAYTKLKYYSDFF